MEKGNPRIVKNQKEFFNKNAELKKPGLVVPFFMEYATKEQVTGFRWLSDRNRILDYGCGTGSSIDAFLEANYPRRRFFVGVDMADVAIQKARLKHPDYEFFTIEDNKVPQIIDGSVDGAYLLHVLHHSTNHEAIFEAIYSKLEAGGKFFICDLSSNNPIISLCRHLYVFCPDFVKKRFADDLVVDGAIPEKYKVNPDVVSRQLKAIGFEVQDIECGHLFFFVFSWIDLFIPISRFVLFRLFLEKLRGVEEILLRYEFFRARSEVFCLRCVKPLVKSDST
jgi:SAM-dependent methyltransferase